MMVVGGKREHLGDLAEIFVLAVRVNTVEFIKLEGGDVFLSQNLLILLRGLQRFH